VTLTVVIPVKNDAQLLRRCLTALAGQTVLADEIIVVDNGSTDETAAVALEFDVRLIAERGAGIAAASSAGYDLVDTELIGRLDADCVPHSTWIASIHDAFGRHPDTVAFTGGARFIDGPRRLRGAAAVGYLGLYYLLVSSALGHLPVFGSNVAMRTATWRAIAGSVHRSDTLMHDDMDLAMHIGPVRRIRFERRLKMGMSMRPLTRFAGSGLRIRRGLHTITAHWPSQLPWLRAFRRLRSIVRTRMGGDD
jgi:glycosyltransferase involved in cell wall biosynthesis